MNRWRGHSAVVRYVSFRSTPATRQDDAPSAVASPLLTRTGFAAESPPPFAFASSAHRAADSQQILTVMVLLRDAESFPLRGIRSTEFPLRGILARPYGSASHPIPLVDRFGSLPPRLWKKATPPLWSLYLQRACQNRLRTSTSPPPANLSRSLRRCAPDATNLLFEFLFPPEDRRRALCETSVLRGKHFAEDH